MRKPSKTLAQIEEQIEEYGSKVDARKQEKELEVIRVPSGLYAIRFTAGGELPDSLKSHFTSKNVAELHIKKYFADKELEESRGPSMFGMTHLNAENCS
jgi:hypothetical protein